MQKKKKERDRGNKCNKGKYIKKKKMKRAEVIMSELIFFSAVELY